MCNVVVKEGFLGRNLKNDLEKIIFLTNKVNDFIEKHFKFLNCHMVDFITENHWEKLLIHSMREELEVLIMENDVFSYKIGNIPETEKYSNLVAFVKEINNLHIRNISKRGNLLDNSVVKVGDVGKMWISQKKYYETDVMANLISEISNLHQSDVILDIGCGKGYLPSLLALGHGLTVLGVDSSDINKSGAEKRNASFQREFLKRNKNTPITNKMEGKFIPVKEEITKFTDIQKLVFNKMNLQDEETKFLMCGLHTCGNLGSDIPHHFITSNKTNVLCYVGCCYHLIEEKYFKTPKFNEDCEENEAGFPISNFLTQKKAKLGRNARMLGCQSLERNILEDKSQSVFYRALLEVILHDHNCMNKSELHVGRLAAKCSSFEEYTYKALDRLNLNHLKENVSSEKIEQYLEDYSSWKMKLNAFQQIRILTSTVVETAIILDRILYLLEQETVSNCHLLQVFDPVKSPRCYCIVAIK